MWDRSLISKQQSFFASGETRSLDFRRRNLLRLKEVLRRYEDEIFAALKSDLGRHPFEAYAGELSLLHSQIDLAVKRLGHWQRATRVSTPLAFFPARAEIHHDPLGQILILAPWNYPIQLSVAPWITALAAGNVAIIKPSELAPASSRLLAQMFAEQFPPELVSVVQGDEHVAQALLKEKFAHIFFTGGERVAKVVLKAAAEHLTPVTLELGGKSPCLVEKTADLKSAAERIVWGKFTNAGQTCVAPDFVYVDQSIAPRLIRELQQALKNFYGENPRLSPDYARIINSRHHARLTALLNEVRILHGGESAAEERYLAPTLVTDVSWNSRLMSEEIFGPILPILTFSTFSEALNRLAERPKPLALYLFSESRACEESVLTRLSFGGGCLNDTMIHLAIPELPFGGVGESGQGAYHGHHGFLRLSHQKAWLRRKSWGEVRLRMPPFTAGRIRWLKRLLG